MKKQIPQHFTLGPVDWFISGHARRRMEQMGVSISEVARCVAVPDLSYKTYSSGHKNNGMTAKKGRIFVIYDPDDHEVITVLPNTQEKYIRADAGFRMPEFRDNDKK